MASTDIQATAIPGGSAARHVAQFFAGLGQAFRAREAAPPPLAEPFALYAPDAVSAHHLLVVERGEPILWSALGDIRRDTRVEPCADFDTLQARTAGSPAGRWMAIVDIDSFETTVDAVDALRCFRAENPDVPVVIGSSYFARHDFSCEHKAIADASVRLPCGRGALALAIGSAIENNRA